MMLSNSNIIQPKVVIIRRPQNQGFGFTLRHFIAYPNEEETWIDPNQRKPLETIFIKEVQPTGPAAYSGLKTGDRVLMVNDFPIGGMSYNAIVQMIKTTPDILRLHVVPKECDALQMSYKFAHTAESNIPNNHLIRFPQAPQQALLPSHFTSGQIMSLHQHLQPQQHAQQQQQQQPPLPRNMISYPQMDSIYSSIQQIHHQQQQQQQKRAATSTMSSPPIQSSDIAAAGSGIINEVVYNDINPSSLALRNDGTLMRSTKPANLTVLQKPNSPEYDLMVRLRKSIEQKEEFLKSPVPHTQTSFFNNSSITSTNNSSSSCNQSMSSTLSRYSLPSAGAAQSSSTSSLNSSKSRFLYNQQIPPTQPSRMVKSPQMSRDLLPASCDMNTFYSKNLPVGISDSILSNRSIAYAGTTNFNNRISHHQNSLNSHNILNSSNSSSGSNQSRQSGVKEQFHKELEFLESLPELGVTNQFFERRTSHLSKGFDPFKPLTINTGPAANSAASPSIAGGIAESVRKFDANVLAAQNRIRMETHKANVAQTTCVEVYTPPKSPTIPEDVIYEETLPISYKEQHHLKPEVIRRQKPVLLDDNKQLRRISYLRATKNEAELQHGIPGPGGGGGPSSNTMELFRKIENDNKRASAQHEIKELIQNDDILEFNGKREMKDAATEVEIVESEMEIKSTYILGKRTSEYRSWRQVKFEVKGDILKIYMGRSSKSEGNVIELDLRNLNILDESVDKKKYVFKLLSKGESSLAGLADDGSHEYTEILFKTKSINEMKKIFGILHDKCGIHQISDTNNQGKQLAEPQKTAATTTYCDDNNGSGGGVAGVGDYSPPSSTSRELEHDSISPVMNKSRKPQKNSSDKDLGSPKTKNWKDLFRRSNNNSNGSNQADISPSNLSSLSKTIGSIGVPLKSCPMSIDNEFVPIIVDVCTKIVETKGLGVTGIYRVPGNKAAISELKEQVNRSDFTWDKCQTDVRWEDVNVVSSLLKQFIRDLPDALLPTTCYINFIEADKKQGECRLTDIKRLLRDLPPHSYETMKHIIRHLYRVSKNCDVNLMEPKNLAIIFGPSIIRTTNETLEIAVKDMKHQCRIVELLVSNYDYFFEDGELPELDSNSFSTMSSTSTSHHDQTTLLLHNVSKIERLHDKEPTLKSRFIPHLRRRARVKRGAVNSDTYSEESVLSLDIRKSPDALSDEKNNKKNVKSSNGSGGGSGSGGSSIGSGSGNTNNKVKNRNSIEISLPLSDDEEDGEEVDDEDEVDEDDDDGVSTTTSNSNNNISDSGSKKHTIIKKTNRWMDKKTYSQFHFSLGSMSLTTITDTLDSKLRNLRSGSESNDENLGGGGGGGSRGIGSRDVTDNSPKPRRNQPLISYENIPYADESPERPQINSEKINLLRNNGKLTKNNHNHHRFSSVYESECSEDSEVSTTSDPKESLVITPLSLKRYKKQRDYRLFRSASFNCRNYRNNNSGNNIGVASNNGGSNYSCSNNSALTKDEKTDMNLTKKRQIQNKQNRSIKRRHTVGGPHDYTPSATRRHSKVTSNKQATACAGGGVDGGKSKKT